MQKFQTLFKINKETKILLQLLQLINTKKKTTNLQFSPTNGAVWQIAPEVVVCRLAEHQRQLFAVAFVAYNALVIGDLEKIEQFRQTLVVFILLSQMQAVRVFLLLK